MFRLVPVADHSIRCITRDRCLRIISPVFCRHIRCSRPSVITQASDEERDSNNVDWDRAWSDFKRNVTSQLPEVESNVTTQAPRFARQTKRDWNGGQRHEDLKQQERFFLNYWTQDTFFRSGGALVIIFFVIMVLIAGPPPSDGRCTLPWC